MEFLFALSDVQKKLIELAAALLFAGLIIAGIHHLGVLHGERTVRGEWDKAVAVQAKQILKAKDELHAREDLHRQETARITDQLHKTEAEHETTVAVLRADAARRLFDAQRRTAAYRADAEAGPAECRALASHTAEFDRALEEGRGLVVELGSTVRLRDAQLRALGAVITNDRNLLGSK